MPSAESLALAVHVQSIAAIRAATSALIGRGARRRGCARDPGSCTNVTTGARFRPWPHAQVISIIVAWEESQELLFIRHQRANDGSGTIGLRSTCSQVFSTVRPPTGIFVWSQFGDCAIKTKTHDFYGDG
jgi:hypothetical protein